VGMMANVAIRSSSRVFIGNSSPMAPRLIGDLALVWFRGGEGGQGSIGLR